MGHSDTENAFVLARTIGENAMVSCELLFREEEGKKKHLYIIHNKTKNTTPT